MEVHILLLDIEAASVWNKLDEESTFYKLYFTLLLNNTYKKKYREGQF